MPWDQRSTMDQKRLFIADYLTRSFTTVELYERYGISHPTGYKWIRRFLDRGYSGLDELPRRPSRCPHRTADDVVEMILELRRRHPSWDGKKLLRVLERRRPTVAWPAKTTITTRPPAPTLRRQQMRFNRFREEYNNERPHEALDQEAPSSVYTPSRRSYPRRLPPVEYPEHFEKRLVSRNGRFRWTSERVPITHTLEGEYIGLEEVDDGCWDVYFGPVRIGQLDERTHTIEDALGNRTRTRRV